MFRKSIFEPHDKHYVPKADEPSPFGPDVKNLVDNPWVVWCRDNPDFDEQRDGSPTLLRAHLQEHLEKDLYCMVELSEMGEPPVACPNGRDVSLGWVIFTHALLGGFCFETIHQRGRTKIKHMLREQEANEGQQ